MNPQKSNVCSMIVLENEEPTCIFGDKGYIEKVSGMCQINTSNNGIQLVK